MTESGRQRLDKWLWVARFFKTRSLAAQAIAGNKVKWNGSPAKPAREIAVGDRLEIRSGETCREVIVSDLAAQRRPAGEARRLYVETEVSRAARERLQEVCRLAPMPGAGLRGRPTKKAGRLIRGFNE
ncbi:MAG: RNA-binding protein [Betaproteobacteria bacterium HGW-Betaproteobacteria-11]|nr:MAG: RNA-binding protein [Betaproteobacteria bacterium HGW-Betaproteobacteria-11]